MTVTVVIMFILKAILEKNYIQFLFHFNKAKTFIYFMVFECFYNPSLKGGGTIRLGLSLSQVIEKLKKNHFVKIHYVLAKKFL